MAESLVKSMTSDWKPKEYHDDFRERLGKVIKARVKTKGKTVHHTADDTALPKNASTNVVDFMSLLKQSIDNKQRTPAKSKSSPRKASHRARPPTPRKRTGKRS